MVLGIMAIGLHDGCHYHGKSKYAGIASIHCSLGRPFHIALSCSTSSAACSATSG